MTEPMQAEDSRIKSLHQEASSHYLRGEFGQALELWRSVIELNPEDERAKEGVRLCELLVDEEVAATGQRSPSPPPAEESSPPAEESPRPPFAEAAEGFDDDLEELVRLHCQTRSDLMRCVVSAAESEASRSASP